MGKILAFSGKVCIISIGNFSSHPCSNCSSKGHNHANPQTLCHHFGSRHLSAWLRRHVLDRQRKKRRHQHPDQGAGRRCSRHRSRTRGDSFCRAGACGRCNMELWRWRCERGVREPERRKGRRGRQAQGVQSALQRGHQGRMVFLPDRGHGPRERLWEVNPAAQTKLSHHARHVWLFLF